MYNNNNLYCTLSCYLRKYKILYNVRDYPAQGKQPIKKAALYSGQAAGRQASPTHSTFPHFTSDMHWRQFSVFFCSCIVKKHKLKLFQDELMFVFHALAILLWLDDIKTVTLMVLQRMAELVKQDRAPESRAFQESCCTVFAHLGTFSK